MKKEMLKKMEMPKKPMAEQEADADMMELGLEDLPAEDMEMSEGEEMAEEPVEGELDMISDEDLISEFKKRGLSLDAEEMPEEDEVV